MRFFVLIWYYILCMQIKFQKFIKSLVIILSYLVSIMSVITVVFAVKGGFISSFYSDINIIAVIIILFIIFGIPYLLRMVVIKLYQNQKIIFFYLISLVSIIILGWILFLVSTTLEKTTHTYGQKPSCKSGYVAVGQGFNGGGFTSWKCEKMSMDAGQACTADSDCEYNCITKGLDVLEEQCPNLNITEGGFCQGVTGICSTTKADSGTIYKKDYVSAIHFLE